jgi:hypothetical protein
MKYSILAAIFILVSLSGKALSSTTTINVELGQAENAYNNVKIDGKTGTLFNLSPALDTISYHRISFITKLDSSTGFRLLYAPLKFEGSKIFSKDINFSGVNFLKDQNTEARYQFNSYRATYFYDAISKKKILFRFGGTLKVRDALVELKQGGQKKFKKNTGVVPLLYLYSKYKFDNNVLFTFDFDGLMAPQGRAFDFALMAGYQFFPSFNLHLGYRMLEGGADNDNVYNFSQINYYFTALQLNF